MIVTIIAQLYAIVGLIALFAYFPQIKLLLKGKKAPTEISIKTWSIWLFEQCVAMLYGVFCLQDFIFCFLTGLDLLLMAGVICLVIHNRYVKFGNQKNFFVAFYKYYFMYPFFSIRKLTITDVFQEQIQKGLKATV
mgnify:CR=1 FL=1